MMMRLWERGDRTGGVGGKRSGLVVILGDGEAVGEVVGGGGGEKRERKLTERKRVFPLCF